MIRLNDPILLIDTDCRMILLLMDDTMTRSFFLLLVLPYYDSFSHGRYDPSSEPSSLVLLLSPSLLLYYSCITLVVYAIRYKSSIRCDAEGFRWFSFRVDCSRKSTRHLLFAITSFARSTSTSTGYASYAWFFL